MGKRRWVVRAPMYVYPGLTHEEERLMEKWIKNQFRSNCAFTPVPPIEESITGKAMRELHMQPRMESQPVLVPKLPKTVTIYKTRSEGPSTYSLPWIH